MASKVIRVSEQAYRLLKIEAMSQKRTLSAALEVLLTSSSPLASLAADTEQSARRDGWSQPVDLTGAHLLIDGVDHIVGPMRHLTYEDEK